MCAIDLIGYELTEELNVYYDSHRHFLCMGAAALHFEIRLVRFF